MDRLGGFDLSVAFRVAWNRLLTRRSPQDTTEFFHHFQFGNGISHRATTYAAACIYAYPMIARSCSFRRSIYRQIASESSPLNVTTVRDKLWQCPTREGISIREPTPSSRLRIVRQCIHHRREVSDHTSRPRTLVARVPKCNRIPNFDRFEPWFESMDARIIWLELGNWMNRQRFN